MKDGPARHATPSRDRKEGIPFEENPGPFRYRFSLLTRSAGSAPRASAGRGRVSRQFPDHRSEPSHRQACDEFGPTFPVPLTDFGPGSVVDVGEVLHDAWEMLSINSSSTNRSAKSPGFIGSVLPARGGQASAMRRASRFPSIFEGTGGLSCVFRSRALIGPTSQHRCRTRASVLTAWPVHTATSSSLSAPPGAFSSLRSKASGFAAYGGGNPRFTDHGLEVATLRDLEFESVPLRGHPLEDTRF